MALSSKEKSKITQVTTDANQFEGNAYSVTVFDHVLDEAESIALLGSYAVAMHHQDSGQLERYLPAELKMKKFFKKAFESFTFYRTLGKEKFLPYQSFADLWKDVEYSLRKETRLWIYIEETQTLFDGNYDCCLVAYSFAAASNLNSLELQRIANEEGVYFLSPKSS